MSEFASSSVEVTDYRVNAATNEEKEKLKELKIQFTDKLNSKKEEYTKLKFDVDNYLKGITEQFYLRFLRGCKCKVDKAVERLLKFFKFAANIDIPKIEYPNSFPTVFDQGTILDKPAPLALVGTCKNNKPLIRAIVKLHDKNNRNMDDLKKYIVYLFETCMKTGTIGDERMTLIFDLNGFSVWKNMDYEFTKYMIDTLQDFYPETLDKCLIVDAPWIFRACWVIIKPWLDPVTASKVAFVKTDELINHVDMQLYTKGVDEIKFKDREQKPESDDKQGNDNNNDSNNDKVVEK